MSHFQFAPSAIIVHKIPSSEDKAGKVPSKVGNGMPSWRSLEKKDIRCTQLTARTRPEWIQMCVYN